MNLCWPKHQRQFHFSPARSLRFVFLFSSIEFIHEKEGKETDGSTDRREFSSTMLVSNQFKVDLGIIRLCFNRLWKVFPLWLFTCEYWTLNSSLATISFLMKWKKNRPNTIFFLYPLLNSVSLQFKTSIFKWQPTQSLPKVQRSTAPKWVVPNRVWLSDPNFRLVILWQKKLASWFWAKNRMIINQYDKLIYARHILALVVSRPNE